MKFKLYILAICFVTLFQNTLQSQGCSDAGICNAGNMQSHDSTIEKGSITFNAQYGLGEQNVRSTAFQIEGKIRVTNNSSLQVKIPYIFINGNLATGSAFGDIIAIGSYKFYERKKLVIGANVGFRISVNTADFGVRNSLNVLIPLPMPYQTSLGTHDLLLGADFKYKNKWLFAVGFQQPIRQFNANTFDTSKVTLAEEKKYFSSNQLFRRPDAIFRVDKLFKIKDKLSITGGVLGIYHLGHDRALNYLLKETAISGSKGLTINVNVGITYKTTDHFSITARYATPIIVRKVRPDGLTRQLVAGLELKYSF
ncbi:MAG: TonB-dependent receptor [Bacteroidetes bacterium]|nr:TonB-dependent receptor [Bacteroidota bacterium]